MSLKQILNSLTQHGSVPSNAVNHEGAPAYRLTPRHRLAQYAHTGSLGATFYASAEAQLADVLHACSEVDDAFIAKTAIHAREHGFMKGMPVLLTAVLAVRGASELEPVFQRVIDNGAMLRAFVIALRSGAFGRKSLGSRSKRLVQKWLNTASERVLLAASIGNAPSLVDVLRLAHPKPDSAWRDAFFKWVMKQPVDVAALPPLTQALERYKCGQGELPDVPFQLLTSLQLSASDWATLAGQGGLAYGPHELEYAGPPRRIQSPGGTGAGGGQAG
jgi:60 kDa SS-A/Ro ribonucleoprotein